MDELADTVNLLSQHARAYQLEERAIDGCALFIRNEESESGLPGSLRSSEVEAKLRSHALIFENSLLGYPCITTQLDLLARGEQVGFYKLITDLHGQVIDDYLAFEGFEADEASG
ncbi:MAG: hypothetical protein LLH30_15235 [Candidatus Manganitrophus sp. SA1]|nr:hypothetical protein [Candidatus Manganitrophus morganii]